MILKIGLIFPFFHFGNRKFYKSLFFHIIKMHLEQVLPHPQRDDIYINEIITPHNEVTQHDKELVNRILLKEVARRGVNLSM